MKISELAKRTGVSTHALRHYERLGLLELVRHANGYSDYTKAMRRAQVISHMGWLQEPPLKKTAASATSHPSRKRSKK
jgi:DNA-binding transcriptional MerR regulator